MKKKTVKSKKSKKAGVFTNVYYGKEVGVKPTEKLKKELEEDSQDITNEIVAESAEEDKNE